MSPKAIDSSSRIPSPPMAWRTPVALSTWAGAMSSTPKSLIVSVRSNPSMWERIVEVSTVGATSGLQRLALELWAGRAVSRAP